MLAVANSQTAITLTWDEPAANGSDVIHYHIEMWSTVSRQWEVATPNGQSLSATHKTFKDEGLTADTNYAYRVRAQNRAPGDNGLGPWSTITFGRTEAAEE